MSIDVFTEPDRPSSSLGPATQVAAVGLFDAFPEMLSAIPVEDRALAARVALALERRLEPGRLLEPAPTARPPALVVLDGLVLRRTWTAGRCVAQMLGPGDIFDACVDDEQWSIPCRTEHVVHRPTTVVDLDDRFRLAVRRWPELHDVVVGSMTGQARRLSRHLAMLALPRVEDRLVMLFSDAADRWGRMTLDGVIVDFPVTHALLGELVGSRRPTISLALADLAASGTIARRDDGRWILAPEHLAAA